MLIIRYETAGAVHVGVAEDDGTVRRLGVPSLGLLLALPTERSGPLWSDPGRPRTVR